MLCFEYFRYAVPTGWPHISVTSHSTSMFLGNTHAGYTRYTSRFELGRVKRWSTLSESAISNIIFQTSEIPHESWTYESSDQNIVSFLGDALNIIYDDISVYDLNQSLHDIFKATILSNRRSRSKRLKRRCASTELLFLTSQIGKKENIIVMVGFTRKRIRFI